MLRDEASAMVVPGEGMSPGELSEIFEAVGPGDVNVNMTLEGGTEPAPEETPGEEGKRDDAYYISFLGDALKEADSKRKSPARKWNNALNIYNNKYDWSGKADWQSTASFPKVALAVEFVSALFQSSLLANEMFFDIDVDSIGGGLSAVDVEKDKVAHLRRELIKDVLKQSDFYLNFPEIAKAFLLTRCYLKCHLAKETTRQLNEAGEVEEINKSKIRVDLTDPRDVWEDPTGRGRYRIHKSALDYFQVADMAEQGVYKQSNLKELQGKIGSLKEASIGRESGDSPSAAHRAEVYLWEYWGDVWDENGELIHRNIVMTGASIADAASMTGASEDVKTPSHLLSGPRPNPFKHGKSPIIGASAYQKPFDVYGKSFVEDSLSLQKLLVEIGNLLVDAAKMASINAVEIDLAQVTDPSAVTEGVHPGWVIKKRGTYDKSPVITPQKLGFLDQATVSLYALIEREAQNALGVTEFVTGAPTTRGRPTATEVVTGRSQATSLLNQVASRMDREILQPLLDMVNDLWFQFASELLKSPNKRIDALVKETIPEWDQLSLEDKKSILAPAVPLIVQGTAVVLSKAAEVSRVLNFLQLVAQFPNIGVYLKFDAMLRKTVEAFGWDAAEVINPNAEEQIQMQQQMMQQQQAMEQGQGPGQPAPPNTPPPPPPTMPDIGGILGGGSEEA